TNRRPPIRQVSPMCRSRTPCVLCRAALSLVVRCGAVRQAKVARRWSSVAPHPTGLGLLSSREDPHIDQGTQGRVSGDTPDDALDADDRAVLQRELTATRERVLVQLGALQRDFNEIVESSELAPPDDEHDPEGVTIAYERAQVSALLDQARED